MPWLNENLIPRTNLQGIPLSQQSLETQVTTLSQESCNKTHSGIYESSNNMIY